MPRHLYYVFNFALVFAFCCTVSHAQNKPFKINPYPEDLHKYQSKRLEKSATKTQQDLIKDEVNKIITKVDDAKKSLPLRKSLTQDAAVKNESGKQQSVKQNKAGVVTSGRAKEILRQQEEFIKQRLAAQPGQGKNAPFTVYKKPVAKVNSSANVAQKAVPKAQQSNDLKDAQQEALQKQIEAELKLLDTRREVIKPPMQNAAIKSPVMPQAKPRNMTGANVPSANVKDEPRNTIKDVEVTNLQSSESSSVLPGVRMWQAQKKGSLLDTLDAWSRVEGVTLVWDTEARYIIPETLSLDGDYGAAVFTLLDLYDDLPVRPVGQMYMDPSDGAQILIIQSDGV